MSVSAFFNSIAGIYLAQSFCHSIIAAVITDRALKAWRISDPLLRQRFRLIVILVPIVSFPLYQLINPARNSVLFRIDSLFDINRWLFLEVWGIYPVSLVFFFILAITSLIFFFQELIPVFRHTLDAEHPEHDGTLLDAGPFFEECSRLLSIEKPEIVLIDDEHPVIFSSTGRHAVIFVSTGLRQALTTEQLQAALAHELAHIARSRRPLLIAVFLLRILMFFNPIVLVKFRRAVRDEEKICDDIAVTLTHNPAALAATLKIFFQKPEAAPEPDPRKLVEPNVSLEDYSHNMQLEERIGRLESGTNGGMEGWGVPFTITLLTLAVLNYFIV